MRPCQRLSATDANRDPSRLTAAQPRARKPRARPRAGFRCYAHARKRSTTALLAGSSPAVGSRNHEHGRWPAGALRRASNSHNGPCFTWTIREATVSTDRWGHVVCPHACGIRSGAHACLSRAGSPDCKIDRLRGLGAMEPSLKLPSHFIWSPQVSLQSAVVLPTLPPNPSTCFGLGC